MTKLSPTPQPRSPSRRPETDLAIHPDRPVDARNSPPAVPIGAAAGPRRRVPVHPAPEPGLLDRMRFDARAAASRQSPTRASWRSSDRHRPPRVTSWRRVNRHPRPDLPSSRIAPPRRESGSSQVPHRQARAAPAPPASMTPGVGVERVRGAVAVHEPAASLPTRQAGGRRSTAPAVAADVDAQRSRRHGALRASFRPFSCARQSSGPVVAETERRRARATSAPDRRSSDVGVERPG